MYTNSFPLLFLSEILTSDSIMLSIENEPE